MATELAYRSFAINGNPMHGTRGLRAGINNRGQYVVGYTPAPGIDDLPECYKFQTVDQARAKWAELQSALIARGYTEAK